MEVALILLGLGFVLAGLAGCLLPVLPGPPLSFAGLLLLWWARDFRAEAFGLTAVLVLGALTVVITIVDLWLPVWGARRYGAGKAGVWGSVLGMLVGLVFFPPFGMILGAFLGALGGELLRGQAEGPALRAAWGVFVGTLAGIGLKLGLCLAIAVLYALELF